MSRKYQKPAALLSDVDADATSPAATARLCGVSRTTIYQAMHADPAKREGLPFLPSLKIGTARRIRREARLKWLADLEAATGAGKAA